jgi:hypothetical protein
VGRLLVLEDDDGIDPGGAKGWEEAGQEPHGGHGNAGASID